MAKKFIIDDPILHEDIEKILDLFEKHYAPAPKKTKPKRPTLKGIASRVDRAYVRLIMRSEKLKAEAAAWEVAGDLCKNLQISTRIVQRSPRKF